jgi:superfamily II DNA or RNA helicase
LPKSAISSGPSASAITAATIKNKTEFIREHVVYAPFSKFPKIARSLDVKTLEKYRNMILVEMPYARHTTRVMEEIYTTFDQARFDRAWKDRWNEFEDEPIKDIAELFRVCRKITGTDDSKLEVIKELLEKHDRLIVFYNFNYELEILRQLNGSIAVGEWNGHKKMPIPDTDKWVYLVQYVAGAEGWNCVDTDAMAFFSLTYSYKNFEQAQGRIDRLNTEYSTLYYYLLMTKSVVDKGILNSLNNKQHFNERAFAKW